MINLNDKIYVTGHRGFVGKRLIEMLEERGFKNILIPKYKIDLTNQLQVKHFFRENQIDHVIHLAAVVGGIKANMADPFKFLFNNLQIQNNVIEAAIENKVKKFVFMSSSCAYPKDYEKQPLKEEYMLEGPLEETNAGYALAKICGAKLCEYANKKFDTKFITLASSNVYGPGDHFNLESSHALSALILKTYNAIHSRNDSNKVDAEIEVWGSGVARREWLYVDDLCDAIIWSLSNLSHTDTFLNVGPGKDIGMNELAEKIIGKFKEFAYCPSPYLPETFDIRIKNDPSKPSGMLFKRLDVSKINGLGWEAKTSLDDGILKTIHWFLKNKFVENQK